MSELLLPVGVPTSSRVPQHSSVRCVRDGLHEPTTCGPIYARMPISVRFSARYAAKGLGMNTTDGVMRDCMSEEQKNAYKMRTQLAWSHWKIKIGVMDIYQPRLSAEYIYNTRHEIYNLDFRQLGLVLIESVFDLFLLRSLSDLEISLVLHTILCLILDSLSSIAISPTKYPLLSPCPSTSPPPSLWFLAGAKSFDSSSLNHSGN
jgi:hypothetical protein